MAQQPLLERKGSLDSQAEVLQSIGRFTAGAAGEYKTWAVIAFVMLTEVPLRVWSWGRSGWDHLVLTDVNWVSNQPIVSTSVFLINMASVAHGGLISVLLSVVIFTLSFYAPEQLVTLKSKGVSQVQDTDSSSTAPNSAAYMARRRIGWIILLLGILGTISRAIVSIGSTTHHSIDSQSSFTHALYQSLQNGETRFRLFIVIPQQAVLGVLASWALSQVAVYILLVTRTVNQTLKYVKEKLEKLEENLKPSDLNLVANILHGVQCMFEMLTDIKGIGLFLITGLMFPIIEVSFWIFVLAELETVGEHMRASTRGLAAAALESCMLCLVFLGFFMYILSTSTSACDSILGKLQKLRIRDPVGPEDKHMDATEEWISPKDVQEKITVIEMYMRGLNGGDGMGLCILGQRMSLSLFKTLIVAYASVGALYLPKALAFFESS